MTILGANRDRRSAGARRKVRNQRRRRTHHDVEPGGEFASGGDDLGQFRDGALQADSLRNRWQAVAAYAAGGRACTPAGKQLVDETCEFFSGVGGQADRTNTILTDIMMAQDFHDLTGQVIRRVVALATSLEEQLVKLLIETSRPEQRPQLDPYKLEGPVVAPSARDDVVADQKGVDDLLASLGF